MHALVRVDRPCFHGCMDAANMFGCSEQASYAGHTTPTPSKSPRCLFHSVCRRRSVIVASAAARREGVTEGRRSPNEQGAHTVDSRRSSDTVTDCVWSAVDRLCVCVWTKDCGWVAECEWAWQ